MRVLLVWEIQQGESGQLQRRVRGTNDWIDTRLTPELQLPTRSQVRSLRELIAFISTSKYLERLRGLDRAAQLDVGCALLDALLVDEALPVGSGTIRLVPAADASYGTDAFDAFVRTIPWPLLARRRNDRAEFLLRDPREQWIVTPTAETSIGRRVRFSAWPRITIAAPDPDAVRPRTDGAEHAAAIQRDVIAGISRLSGRTVVPGGTCTTWRQFHAALTAEDQPPDVIYYYGHGQVKDGGTELLFCDPDKPDFADWVPAWVIGKVLEQGNRRGQRPALFYANCCWSDGNAESGVGRVVGPHVDALIASRTSILMRDAQDIGAKLLARIVLECRAPHEAVLDFYDKDLSLMGPADNALRWAVPVLYVNYDDWSVLAPELRLTETGTALGMYAAYVPERVGRNEALVGVEQEVKSLLSANRKGVSAVFWRAEERQGLTGFGGRMQDHLRETFADRSFVSALIELDPGRRWPRDLDSFFEDGVAGALGEARRDAGDALKRWLPRAAQRLTLVLLHRGLSTSDGPFLVCYLDWWRGLFEQSIGDRLAHVVLGFPIEPRSEDGWRFELTPAHAEPAGPAIRVLDISPEFPSLTVDEIASHISLFGAIYRKRSPHAIQQEAHDIYEASGQGVFQDVVDGLKVLMKLNY